ncbi:beta-xylosidase [Bacteroidia bacterium]|nr:beta-xylosidase [Bacteroidia bacterium]
MTEDLLRRKYIKMNYKILSLFLLFCTALPAQNIRQTYRNPVIAGDFPDPSMIRVGEDYYAAGTSSDFAPNYPLYHSTDLVNWTRIGFVFPETPEWIAGSCWAPELFYHNDTFYVYYTARKKSDNTSCIGVATTKNISGGFTDHGPLIEWGNEAIDAFVFCDTDKQLYIIWKAYGLDPTRPIELLASGLSPNGLALTGEVFSLTKHDDGWIGHGDEGECLVKHGEYYYLLYSIGGCCDNRCDYNVRVARSKSLKGHWEQYPEAILEGGGIWKCSGHGTLVETPDKRYFYLYHAYNAYDFEFVGRQGLLDELGWDENSGWPYFKTGNHPSAQAEMPFPNTKQVRKTVFYDDFSSNQPNYQWQWDMKSPQDIRFFGINPLTGNYTMETAVVDAGDDLKGLAVYGNAGNYIAWGVKNNELQLYEVKNGEKHIINNYKLENNTPSVYLKIESVTGRLFRFYWSSDQNEWHTFMEANAHYDGSYIPRWGAGIHAGLLVENSAGNQRMFPWFKLETSY